MTSIPTIALVPAGGRQHLADLTALQRRGLALAHDHASWPLHNTTAHWIWVRVLENEALLSGFAVELHRSRAIPGMRIGRIRRFGSALHRAIFPVATELLDTTARQIPRLLRLDLEIFEEDHKQRQSLASTLLQDNWQPAAADTGYRETLRLPLIDTTDAALLSGFNARTRRNLRKTLRDGTLRFGSVTAPEYAPQLHALHQASFARSGGNPPALDVAGMLADAYEQRHSILLGCFDQAQQPPHDLIAFAWITAQGDHAAYSHAGAKRTRNNVAPGAVIMWEAIRWARDHGFDWFDLGGATLPDGDSNHPLSGISSFKRGFSKNHIEIATTLSYFPHRRLSNTLDYGRRFVTRFSRRHATETAS